MTEVIDFIRRVIDKTTLKRESFSDSKLPSKFSSIQVITFFGDITSEFTLSTLLLHRLIDRDKYTILCSWPGHSYLYPYVDEYWSVNEDGALNDLVRGMNGWTNPKSDVYERLLLRYFEVVKTIPEMVDGYYKNGFTSKFFKEFSQIEYQLPSIPSVNFGLSNQSKKNADKLIFLYPRRYIRHWSHGDQDYILTSGTFWKALANSLLSSGYTPVIYHDYSTHDLSTEYNDRCMIVAEKNLAGVLGIMRACDCVLDIFTGISKYALIARCPYLICDERQRYFNTREYELDDLCGSNIPHQNMFSFAPVVAGDSATYLADGIKNKLQEFLKTFDRSILPSTIETFKSLSYSVVKKREAKKIGLRFFPASQIRFED